MRIILFLSFFLLFTFSAFAENANTSNEIITDYPINMQPFSENAILRVVKVKSKMMPTELTLKNIQIIDNNIVAYKKDFITNDYPIGFKDYAIVKGTDRTYLLYKLDEISTSETPDYYYVIYTNDKTIQEAEGFILSRSNLEKIIINNPKLSEHEYQLIDNKYITSTLRDNFLEFSTFFEILNGKIYETDGKELNIELIPNKEYAINSLQNVLLKQGNFNFYTKPILKDEYRKTIKIKPESTIEIYGLINTKPLFIKDVSFFIDSYYAFRLLHVSIDGVEGWLNEYYLH